MPGMADDEEETPDGPDTPRLGVNIRRVRNEKKLSLQSLADLSGVSVGMISQIERDLTSPSLRTLTKIRLALKVPLSALFDEERYSVAGDPTFLRRAGRRPKLTFGRGALIKEILSSSDATSDLQFMFVDVPPRQGTEDQPVSYASEKGGLVLSGQVVLDIDGVEATLNEGDSFQFDGSKPHGFRNPHDSPARLMWIIVQTRAERHL